MSNLPFNVLVLILIITGEPNQDRQTSGDQQPHNAMVLAD